MTVTYKGVDCVADIGSDLYVKYKKISQTGKHAWGYQANYAIWSMYFAAVLVFLVVLRKGFYLYSDWSYRNTKIGKKNIKLGFVNRFTATSRIIAYRRFPLIFSKITGLPSKLGTLIIFAASTIFIVCLCFAPGYLVRPCRGFGSPPLSVRTGVMSTALTPFIIIMSGKTNFISFITGISYEKLNIFHQSLGWGALFLALLHTFPFLVQSVKEGGMARLRYMWNEELIYRNGVPPLIFLFLLCFLSTRFSRALVYEIWFHSHWVFGAAYVGTLWYHCYDSMASDKYLWATMTFWGFQMFYRALVKTTFKPNQYAFKSKPAQLSLLPGGAFEISVPINGKKELDWAPGQHIFIRFMQGIHTLDNHPFSILTIPEAKSGSSTLKLIVRPQKGLTKKLYDLIENDEAGKKLRCFIDGPYGGMNRDPLAFDKLILVSTGTGVSVTAPFVSYVSSKLTSATNCVQKVEFLWIVKSLDAIDWIRDELENALSYASELESLPIFDIKIFVTGSLDGVQPEIITSKSQIADVSNTDESGANSDKESNDDSSSEDVHKSIKIYQNMKPNIQKLLNEAELLEKTAIICCGAASIQEACGNAASSLQKRALKGDVQEVYLHTENFGW